MTSSVEEHKVFEIVHVNVFVPEPIPEMVTVGVFTGKEVDGPVQVPVSVAKAAFAANTAVVPQMV